jgi:hypothetical protein
MFSAIIIEGIASREIREKTRRQVKIMVYLLAGEKARVGTMKIPPMAITN